MSLAVFARILLESKTSTQSDAYIGDDVFIVYDIKDSKTAKSIFIDRITQEFARNQAYSGTKLKQWLQTVLADGLAVQFAGGIVVGTKLFLFIKNQGQIWIKRGKKITPVITKPGVVSGPVREGDLLLLLSGRICTRVSAFEIKQSLKATSHAQVIKELRLHIHKRAQGQAIVGRIKSASVGWLQRPALLATQVRKVFSKFSSIIKPAISSYSAFGKHRKLLAVGILTLLLFGVVMVGLRKKQNDGELKEANEVLKTVEHQLEEGAALIDLNPLRARELISDADSQLNSLDTAQLPQETQIKAREFEVLIAQRMELALRRYQIELLPFFELQLLREGAQGDRLSLYQDVLGVVDGKNQAVYTLSIPTKSSRIVTVSSLVRADSKVDIGGEDVFVFAEVVYHVESPEGTLRQVVSVDTEWRKIVDMKVFADNVYLLDSEAHQIWKYERFDAGYLPKSRYLRMDTKPDFREVTAMMIDGDIWVVAPHKIHRFSQGEELLWRPTGLEKALGAQIDIYTDELSNNLYVLDLDHRRVVVMTKAGEYLAQYQWSSEVEISDFVVSEKLKKILLLSGGTIYEIELK